MIVSKEALDALANKTGKAACIVVWAAIRNSELNDGSGHDVDDAYYETEEGARLGAVGINVSGTDGKVAPRLAIRFDDGLTFLVHDGIVLVDETELRDTARRKALSKLRPAERTLLGIKD